MSHHASDTTPNNREFTIAGLVHQHDDPFDALAAIESEPGGLALMNDPNFVGIVIDQLWEKFDDCAVVDTWLSDMFEQSVINEYYDADASKKFAATTDPDVAGIFQDPRHADPSIPWVERCDENYVISLESTSAALQVIADCDEPTAIAGEFADASIDFAADREFLTMALAVLSTKKYDQTASIEYLVELFGDRCMTTLTKKDEVAASVPAES